MKTPLLCLWLALCAGCSTTERLPMRSDYECIVYGEPIKVVVESLREASAVEGNFAGIRDALRQASRNDCPPDFLAAVDNFAAALDRLPYASREVIVQTNPAGAIVHTFDDDCGITDAALRLKLIAKSYGVQFDR